MSRGFSHTMTSNKGNSRPSHVLFADVESHLTPEPNGITRFTPFLWVLAYRRYRTDGKPQQLDWFHGAEPGAFWELVNRHTWEKKRTYLVTHHLEVDFLPLCGFTQLRERGWTLDKFICNGRTLALFYHKDKRKLIVMNNGNLFDSSIAEWGKLLGLPKLEMPKSQDPASLWLTYCQRDTLIMVRMWDALLAFMDEHNLGNFKLTRASLALSAFRHRFMSKSIAIHKDPKSVVLERRAYHGGRFEALQFGDFTNGPFYELDVSSMYGWIEAWASLPTELRGYRVYPQWNEFVLRLQRYCVIATVVLDSPEPFVPIWEHGKVLYESGVHTVTLCTPELQYALRRGYIRKVIRMTWYYKARILREYARYFLELKSRYDLAGNSPYRNMAKFFPNAIYGKLAQRGFVDKVIGSCDTEIIESGVILHAQTGKRQDIFKYGGKVHLVDTTLRAKDSFIAISAHITAHARMYLWQLMKLAGLRNVYHVATDSLTVNEAGYRNLQRAIHPYKPGTLKLKAMANTFSVKAPNDVVLGDDVKIKGISKNAVQVDDNTYIIEEWPKMTTLMKKGAVDGYYTRARRKVLARPDYFGVMGIPNPSIVAKERRVRPRDLLTPAESVQCWELESEIAALRAARKVPHRLVFRLWDYRKGGFKRVRNTHGILVPLEQTETWGRPVFFGFDTVSEVKRAVQSQLSIDKLRRTKQAAVSALLSSARLRVHRPDDFGSKTRGGILIVPSHLFIGIKPVPAPVSGAD